MKKFCLILLFAILSNSLFAKTIYVYYKGLNNEPTVYYNVTGLTCSEGGVLKFVDEYKIRHYLVHIPAEVIDD